MMIEFSVDNYGIQVFIGEPPIIWDHYAKNAVFIDKSDLDKEGTPVYVIISRDFTNPRYAIIAFSTDRVNYGGFRPGLYYETTTQVLFIGAGDITKTFALASNTIVFEKHWGFGFWGWGRYKDFIFAQEELEFHVFNLAGEHLWEESVEPPYDLEMDGDIVIIRLGDVVKMRVLATGEKV